jgi:DNA-binding CsgD family transcriptional regulator
MPSNSEPSLTGTASPAPAPGPVPRSAPGPLMTALEAIDSIRSAQDAAQCLERLFQATAAIGAEVALYTVAMPEDEGDLSSIMLFACDPAFAHEIFELGPLHTHPWLRQAGAQTPTGQFDGLADISARDSAALQLAERFGFGGCLVVPVLAGAQLQRAELLCLGFGASASPRTEDLRILRLLARSLAAELHEWFCVHLRQSLNESARLQAQDIQLLSLEWQGLCSKDIARHTGLSVSAVNSRFQRLSRRLNCKGRRAAARRAAEHSLLAPVPPDLSAGLGAVINLTLSQNPAALTRLPAQPGSREPSWPERPPRSASPASPAAQRGRGASDRPSSARSA